MKLNMGVFKILSAVLIKLNSLHKPAKRSRDKSGYSRLTSLLLVRGPVLYLEAKAIGNQFVLPQLYMCYGALENVYFKYAIAFTLENTWHS